MSHLRYDVGDLLQSQVVGPNVLSYPCYLSPEEATFAEGEKILQRQ